MTPESDYDLSGWSVDARDSLEFLVQEAGIPFRWRDTTLVVATGDAGGVDERIRYLSDTSESVDDADTSPPRIPNGPPVYRPEIRGGGGAGAGGYFRLPPRPPPAAVTAAKPGWYTQSGGHGHWGWWDGTAWAGHGGSDAPAPSDVPPGWYPDPWDRAPQRWWDGYSWTGYAGTDEERPWFPPRHTPDDADAIRGGGLALVGFVAGELVGLALGIGLFVAGAKRHSILLVSLPQLALWGVLLGVCAAAVRRYGDGSLRSLGLTRIRARDLGVGILAAFIARTAAGLLAVPFAPFLPKNTVRNTSLTGELQGSTVTVIVVGAIIVVGAPFFEELFFRGLVQSALTRRWGARVGVLGQAGCFALVHYQVGMGLAETLLTVLAIGFFGVYLGVLRFHYQRLGPGIVAHAVFNLAALMIVLAIG